MLNAVQAIPLIEALIAAGISTAADIANTWKGKGLMTDEEMNATLEQIAKNADARAAQAAKSEAGED